MKRYTIRDFERNFPDDAACLDWLRTYLYPDGIFCASPACERVTKHHRIASRPSYSCDRCGRHEHPMAGTIFEGSRTPLRLWFRAVYLMASTRSGVSAKHLERELGVTYKTAWRMFHLIRSLLGETESLSGSVEADETYIGARRRGKRGRGAANKTIVFGAVERGGRVIARMVPNTTAAALVGKVQEHVLSDSIVYTDELPSYNRLPKRGYEHRRVRHAAKVYVSGDAHTNTMEGFWSLVKRGIGGVYHNVSAKHLQSYLDEYAFRYSHRNDAAPMFQTFLRRVEKASAD